jgi:hypothetical protein
MGFWAADPPGWRHQIMERYGYDPMRATARDTLESVYVLLRERVRGDLGLFREEPPRRPDPCMYTEPKALAEAEDAWRTALCACERWTRDEQLDEHLWKDFAWHS